MSAKVKVIFSSLLYISTLSLHVSLSPPHCYYSGYCLALPPHHHCPSQTRIILLMKDYHKISDDIWNNLTVNLSLNWHLLSLTARTTLKHKVGVPSFFGFLEIDWLPFFGFLEMERIPLLSSNFYEKYIISPFKNWISFYSLSL